MDALKLISSSSLKPELPVLNVGDTVKVHCRIQEGDKSRIQVFEGTIIAKKHGGVNETFTVRRVAYGCRNRKSVPGSFSECGKSRNRSSGPRSQKQTVLPA